MRCVEIVPRNIVQNDTDYLVEIRSGDLRVTLKPGEMQAPKFSTETAPRSLNAPISRSIAL